MSNSSPIQLQVIVRSKFCQQQNLNVDIQLHTQLKRLHKQIVEKGIVAKKQTRLEDFINSENY